MTIYTHLLLVIDIQNVGPHFERWNAGVLGPITLSGLNEGRRDLTWQKWSYKVLFRHSSCFLFLIIALVCLRVI